MSVAARIAWAQLLVLGGIGTPGGTSPTEVDWIGSTGEEGRRAMSTAVAYRSAPVAEGRRSIATAEATEP